MSPSTEPLRNRGAWPIALALTVSLAGALWAPACKKDAAEPAQPAPPVYPAGTVIAFDGLPISASEVERWVPVIAMMEPDKVERHWRRLALANFVLPFRAAETLDPAGRNEAYRAAQHLHGQAVELNRVPEGAEFVDVASGTFHDMGLADWYQAKDLEVGAWSPVYETLGGFAFYRLLEKPAQFGPRSPIRIERVQVHFLDPRGVRTVVDDALRALPIDIVDPEWEALVPPLYLQNLVKRHP